MSRSDAPIDRFALRKTPRQARAIATFEAVLDAAARILVAEGYAAASTNRIAEVAGVSIGSLYEYFPGKDAVFAQLRRREGLQFYAGLVAEPRPQAPRDIIRHLVTSRIEWARQNPELYWALESQVPREAVADAERWVYNDFITISIRFFDEHRAELRPTVDSEFLSEFLMRMVSATVHDFAMQAPERLDDPQLADVMIDVVERFLLD